MVLFSSELQKKSAALTFWVQISGLARAGGRKNRRFFQEEQRKKNVTADTIGSPMLHQQCNQFYN